MAATGTPALDVEAVRARFSALSGSTAFFDGPGGTQVPGRGDRRDGRLSAQGECEHRRLLRDQPPDRRRCSTRRAGRRPRCSAASRRRSSSGPNMTSLNFTLTRTLGRELAAGDEILVTRLDHDANVSPWLELAHDLALEVRLRRIRRGGDAWTWTTCDGACRSGRASSPSPGRPTRSARWSTSPRSPRSLARRAHSPGSTRCTTRRTGRSTWPRRAPTS